MRLFWMAIAFMLLGLPTAAMAQSSDEQPQSDSVMASIATTPSTLDLPTTAPLTTETPTQQIFSLPNPPRFGTEQLNQSRCPDGSLGTRDLLKFQPELTTPSLWWARDQFAAEAKFGGKLFVGWLACSAQQQGTDLASGYRFDVAANSRSDKPSLPDSPAEGGAIGQEGASGATSRPDLNSVGAVNVIVNAQLWSLLERLERYEFLHQFGTAVTQAGQDANQKYQLWVFDRQGELLGFYVCPFVNPEVPNFASGVHAGLPGNNPVNLAQAWTPTPTIAIPQYRFKRAPTSCLYLND
ncbi:MAG: hypothetical protein VKJ24_10275 [Synechococcales bacterium]|nr:hypothetical protein [Synechococcales bacterium]